MKKNIQPVVHNNTKLNKKSQFKTRTMKKCPTSRCVSVSNVV